MKILHSILIRASILLAVSAILSQPGSARAQTYQLTVDSSQSSLTLSGMAFGIGPGTPQGATGLVDKWGGTIIGTLSGGTWTFYPGWSAITAVVNPSAPFSIAPWPVPTITVPNYGLTMSGLTTIAGAVTLNASYGDLTLDITGGTATAGSPTAIGMAFTAGKLDWGASGPLLGPGTGGNSSMVGVSGVNSSVGLVGWDGTTLTLPILLNTTGSNRTEQWAGTIVAINPVLIPEPSTVALALVGLGMLAGARRARWA